MKILKVVVDKIPESCFECDLYSLDCEEVPYCPLLKMYADVSDRRPDCPLELSQPGRTQQPI